MARIVAERIVRFQSIALQMPPHRPSAADKPDYDSTMDGNTIPSACSRSVMQRAAKVWISGSVLAASILIAGSVQAAPASTFMPQSFLGEAAVVAFAFSLPALVAGTYLAMERLWVGIQRRIGVAAAAVGLVALVAVAAASVFGGNTSLWGGNWMVLARS